MTCPFCDSDDLRPVGLEDVWKCRECGEYFDETDAVQHRQIMRQFDDDEDGE